MPVTVKQQELMAAVGSAAAAWSPVAGVVYRFPAEFL
jgi:hypothetical protein